MYFDIFRAYMLGDKPLINSKCLLIDSFTKSTRENVLYFIQIYMLLTISNIYYIFLLFIKKHYILLFIKKRYILFL